MDKDFPRMKIAIIGSRGIPATYGGFETFAEEISWRLANDSFDVTVICQAAKNVQRNFDKTKLVYSKFTKDRNPVRFYFDSLKIASSTADIILVCGVGGAIFYPFLKRKKTKIFTHVDGREELRSKYSALKKMYVRISQYFTAKYSDHIIADSYAVMKTWKTKYSIADSKISTIEFGAHLIAGNDSHLEDMNLVHDEYYLVVCRMVPENNPEMIIKGFVVSGSEKKLVLVGDLSGKFGKALLRHASHKIIFPGGIYDKGKLATLRRNCFAYIHGHSVGGTNPSLLESMDAGKVCICHDNKFNRETTDNGMVFFENASDLSEKIKLVENLSTAEKDKMIIAGKARISSTYNWENITKRYIQLFNSSSGVSEKFDIHTEQLDHPASIAELAEFLRNEYPSGEISDEKYLAWEYLHNPSGKALVTTARNDKGEIVSQYALTPMDILVNNSPIAATLSLNTLTAGAYRGKGLFLATANDAFNYCENEGIQFTYGIPNSNSFHGFIGKLRFTHAGNLIFMTKPLEIWNVINGLMNRKSLKKGDEIDFVPDKNNLNKNSVSELIFPADEKRYNDFLSLWSKQDYISIRKTVQDLNWRYIQNPLRKYTLLKIEADDEIKAIAVIRTLYLYGMKVCLVMEHLSCDNLFSKKLLNVISDEAKRNHMDLMIAVAASKKNKQFKQLMHSGFKSVPAFMLPQQLPFITRMHGESEDAHSLNDLKNWHFSFGDYDVF
jgi:glycosyltransferase involved in cell wall biosynthesis